MAHVERMDGEDNELAFGSPQRKEQTKLLAPSSHNSNLFSKMSGAQTELTSKLVINEMEFEVNKKHAYLCLCMLVLISLSNTMQRSCLNYMYAFYSEDHKKANDEAYNIRLAIKDFSYDNYCLLVGDTVQFIYAVFVLFTGSMSDFIDRKLLICVACFGWTICTYLSAYADNFNQFFILKIMINFFSAFQGPCSYSLLTDWIKPGERTLAYAFYALGV